MELVYKKREKAVGALIICAAALLLSMVVVIGRGKNWFKTYVTYYTIFNEGYNLREDAAVKLSKANIGTVKGLILLEDKVKVELSILEEYAAKVKSDSVATVESPTFIGDEYVSIKAGSKGAALLSEGGVIPSKEKMSITDYLEKFEVEKTLKMLAKAIQNLSELTQNMADPTGPLLTGLDSLNRITRDVEAGKGSVGNLLKSEAVRIKIEEILKNIEKATEKAPGTIDKMDDNLLELKKILKNAEESMGTLQTALSNIEKGSNDVPQITNTTKRGVQEIRDAVVNIDKVFKSIQQNALIRSKIPLEPEAESIDAGLR